MVDSIKSVLMKRDNMSEHEANEAINEARDQLYDMLAAGEDPYYICEYEFGLEPDYLEDLLF